VTRQQSLRVTFRRSLTPDEYAEAVLTCQLALTMIGMNDVATVWPDGTATNQQINDVSDRWLAGNPWGT
jgi:hypothetical protein